MPDFKARVVTPWVAQADDVTSPDKPSDHPQLADDHTLKYWEDVTAQPRSRIVPDPNEYTIEIVCTEAVLDAIEGDATYFVSWSEEIEGT
jgi:hypothetical protein